MTNEERLAISILTAIARTEHEAGGCRETAGFRRPVARGSRDRAGEQVKGRKIHTLVDGEGLSMRVVVHSAAIQDRDGAGLVLDKLRKRFLWLELIWADGGYNVASWSCGSKAAAAAHGDRQRSDDTNGFVVLPRRWVVERTFSWFGRNRRLAKDFENLATTLETFVTLASIQLALRRLTRE
jgi:putative transposase